MRAASSAACCSIACAAIFLLLHPSQQLALDTVISVVGVCDSVISVAGVYESCFLCCMLQHWLCSHLLIDLHSTHHLALDTVNLVGGVYESCFICCMLWQCLRSNLLVDLHPAQQLAFDTVVSVARVCANPVAGVYESCFICCLLQQGLLQPSCCWTCTLNFWGLCSPKSSCEFSICSSAHQATVFQALNQLSVALYHIYSIVWSTQYIHSTIL